MNSRRPIMKVLLSALLCLLVPVSLTLGQDKPLELADVEGNAHQPLKLEPGKKAVVLLFVSPYCPTAGKFLPEFNRIAAGQALSFSFYLVHSDPETTVTDAYKQAVLNEVKSTVLIDKDQALAKKLNARITPECVVLNPAGEVVYQGRMNDLYLAPTKRQRQATTKELSDALEAISAGKPVATPHTEAVGCKIGGLAP